MICSVCAGAGLQEVQEKGVWMCRHTKLQQEMQKVQEGEGDRGAGDATRGAGEVQVQKVEEVQEKEGAGSAGAGERRCRRCSRGQRM